MNQPVDPARCPLCGRPNHCQLCTTAAYKGSCWCFEVEIPAALLARVPTGLRNRACVCRDCVMAFHREEVRGQPVPRPRAVDFCFENGRVTFSAASHLRRGLRRRPLLPPLPPPRAARRPRSREGA